MRRVVLCAGIAAAIVLFGKISAPHAVPTGFADEVVFSGLTQPTAIRFSPDGRIFVAEKSGLIWVYHGLSDTSPTVFADLRTEVHNFWDRGVLGIALDPSFPTKPYVYVSYTLDAPIGGTPPVWGVPGATSDGCPTPPGPTTDGCVVSGRLSRLTASGDTMTAEKVLINAWCQQYPSHSMGALNFGVDGKLYMSAGEGASFDWTDYGQKGSPLNPCGDPPGGVGAQLSPPTSEGGSLRAQSLMRASGEPILLNGTIIRVDPATGNGLPTNPLASSSDANARRIVAYGLRNPFRFTIRPGTNEVWVGDVGSYTWEEIDRIQHPLTQLPNFGWPCYEGRAPNPDFQSVGLNICNTLYGSPGLVTAPYFTYNHNANVVPGDGCSPGSSATTGLAFDAGDAFPSQYKGALFFADYARSCIWVMYPGANGLPDPTKIDVFARPAWHPVDLEFSPSGDLFYVDITDGEIHRIHYYGSETPPVAVAHATPTSGAAPLTVQFDASGSYDPDGDTSLTYAWDLNGDGVYDDSTAANPSWTYQAGTWNVGLKVTDSAGLTGTTTIPINVESGPPTATIDNPLSTFTWKVGQKISFSGSAADFHGNPLPASDFSWSLIIHHCPSNCHTHFIQQWDGVKQGSFAAPDHEYPSWLELILTVKDSAGATTTTSVLLHPKTVDLTFNTFPAGLQLVVGSTNAAAPFTKTVILGSDNTLTAPTPQNLNGGTYAFTSWSDGGGQTHDVVASKTLKSYTASFDATACPNEQFTGQYFANQTLSGSPAFTRCDQAVDFSWGLGGPLPGLVDHFSARWNGMFTFAAGTYRFKARVDDGVRVWVDGNLLIDHWVDPGAPTTYTATTPLAPGLHQVQMEYYEDTDKAVAVLSWAPVP